MRFSQRWQGRLRLCAAATLAGLSAVGLVGCLNTDVQEPVQITTVSNRADLVSGGNVMVQITLPPSTKVDGLVVTVDGRDVSSAFSTDSSGRVRGVVTGLAVGNNTITAATATAGAAALVVTNAPRHGPVMSGASWAPPTPCFCLR